MAITYPRALPVAPAPRKNTFELIFNIDVMESPITKQAVFDEKQGHRWEGIFYYPKMTSLTAREWKAWFTTMKGPMKTFYCFDPDNKLPVGIAAVGTDTPLVRGAGQGGTSVLTDAWRVNGTGLLLPGDDVQVGTEYKRVTETVSSNASGIATINFEPKLHGTLADNAAVVFDNPKGIFRMDGMSVQYNSDEFGVHEFAIAFVEHF